MGGRKTLTRVSVVGGLAGLFLIGSCSLAGSPGRDGDLGTSGQADLISVESLAEAGGAPSPGLPDPGEVVFAQAQGDGRPGRLVRLDPTTLRPVDGESIRSVNSVRWTVSPDDRYAVAAAESNEDNRLIVVDLRRFEKVGRIDLDESMAGSIASAVWLPDDRLWLQRRVTYPPDLEELAHWAVTEPRVEPVRWRSMVIDVPRLEVVSTETIELPMSILSTTTERQWETSRVLLGTGFNTLGPATLALVDADGQVRAVTLERITAGRMLPSGEGPPRIRMIGPSLAVDPDEGRAFVLAAGSPVAEVDLTDLSVRYHRLDGERAVASEGAGWKRLFVSTATAKEDRVIQRGTERDVEWLGDRRLVVTGTDRAETAPHIGAPEPTIIDTESWTTTRFAPPVAEWPADMWPVGDVLLITPSALNTPLGEGGGLLTYRPGDDAAVRLLDRENIGSVDVVGRYAFIRTSLEADAGRLIRLDLDVGKTEDLPMVETGGLTLRLLPTTGVIPRVRW